MLDDPATAPIPDADKVLFAFVEKMNAASHRLTRADVEAVRDAGWTDEAIYDAITVCALFNFYNVWVDGNGVDDLPADGYRASGRRLAENGYVME